MNVNSQITLFEGSFDPDTILREMLYERDEIAEDALYLCDLSDIVRKYFDWRLKMPRVKPFYAVKCNNHNYVLRLLGKLGAGFDCASRSEIDAVLGIGVSPNRIIYAHPAKPTKHLQHACATNTSLMTFDSMVELTRIHRIFPTAQLILRIKCDAKDAMIMHGLKFGCDPVEAPRLLVHARNLGLNVMGVSFHIGSGGNNPEPFGKAIGVAREIFQCALTLGYRMTLLDIGGGFPGHIGFDLSTYADVINEALDEFFPLKDFPNLTVISEPGTYFVESAATLGARMYSKNEIYNGNDDVVHVKYFVTDSIYGSFGLCTNGYNLFIPRILKRSKDDKKAQMPHIPCSIWGQTASGFDKICDNFSLPNVDVDDVLVFGNIGNYSIFVSGHNFNGFPTTKVRFFANRETMEILAH